MVADADTISCVCGALFASRWGDVGDPEADVRIAEEEFYSHVSDIRNNWLATNGYDHPISGIQPGLTCIHCGLVVGWPDRHRKMCPDKPRKIGWKEIDGRPTLTYME